jgi:hypothetical protein
MNEVIKLNKCRDGTYRPPTIALLEYRGFTKTMRLTEVEDYISVPMTKPIMLCPIDEIPETITIEVITFRRHYQLGPFLYLYKEF